jgi:sugar phosphate isomerase/epimerase
MNADVTGLHAGLASDAVSQDLETAVLLALEWGINALELKRFCYKRVPDLAPDEVAQIRSIQTRYPFELVSLSPGVFKGPLTDGEIAAGFRRLDDTIALANALDIPRVVVFGFERTDGSNRPLDQLLEVFREVERRGRQANITILIENDRGHWLNDTDLLEATIRGVGSRHLLVNWDPCNLIGEAPISQIKQAHHRLSDVIGHVHVKDASEVQGREWKHAMLDEGDVPWDFHIQELQRAGFAGYMVVEPHFGHRITGTLAHVQAFHRLLQRNDVGCAIRARRNEG